jgi:hypothetical protein
MALCFMGILAAASTTQAQLSNVPRRYRSANRKVRQRRESRTPSEEQRPMLRTTPNGIKKRQEKKARKLVAESLSLPALDQAGFDPSSMPIMESRVDISSLSMFTEFRVDYMSMSMPITKTDYEFSMSLPIMEFISTETIGIGAASGDGNDGQILIYAGFLVGMSALMFAAAAMFAKMRHVHARQIEVERSGNGRQDIVVY